MLLTRPIQNNINPNNSLSFNGIYRPSISVITASSETTVREYEDRNRSVLAPSYGEGEESFTALLGQRFRELMSLFSNTSNTRNTLEQTGQSLDLTA